MAETRTKKESRQARLIAPVTGTGRSPADLSVEEFRDRIRKFYRKHKRPMPWRETDDPYAILVSEIMLQQTQVPRVMQKYGEFLAAFPGFPELAASSLPDLLNVWQGMGYNRRAIALRKIAGIVMDEYAGKLPRDPEILATFPGIGPATASSVAAFAFNAPVVFIETNIRRVFIHCFFADREEVRDSEIEPLVAAALDKNNPREWYWALMDFGTHLRNTQENPNRRSAHYTKQSKFEGSRRQVRGRILKELLAHPGRDEHELADAIDAQGEILEEILLDLANEGFITRENNKVTIVNEGGDGR
ncbi:MAG: A/G-specific adenine glycosylase [Methanoregulaceae archaeon]